jgi:hypothetical protein
MQLIDKNSVAYKMGYEQGRKGRKFRNPCSGNKLASDDHYAGFLAGEADRKAAGEA